MTTARLDPHPAAPPDASSAPGRGEDPDARLWPVTDARAWFGVPGRFTRRLLATTLLAQSLIVFFGALVVRGFAVGAGEPERGTVALWVGGGLAVGCLLVTGLLRLPGGVVMGWLVQLLTLASALVLPSMILVALIFGALWVTALVQGRKVDRIKADAEAAAGEQAPGTTPDDGEDPTAR